MVWFVSILPQATPCSNFSRGCLLPDAGEPNLVPPDLSHPSPCGEVQVGAESKLAWFPAAACVGLPFCWKKPGPVYTRYVLCMLWLPTCSQRNLVQGFDQSLKSLLRRIIPLHSSSQRSQAWASIVGIEQLPTPLFFFFSSSFVFLLFSEGALDGAQNAAWLTPER